MLIMQNALPGINKFLQPVAMNSKARELVISCIIAFLMHLGKMSATQAAGAVRSQGRHRAQICRFLGRKYWKRLNLLKPLQHDLLEMEPTKKASISSLSIKQSAPYRPNRLKTPTTQETHKNEPEKATASRRNPQNGPVTALSWDY